MALDDHLGEILRKARTAAAIAPEQAAHAAGLTTAQLDALERTGSSPVLPNLRQLAQHLKLHPDKLLAIANGWVPEPVKLDRWRELRQVTTTQNDLTVHAYVVWDEVSREAAVFDTGWEAEPILSLMSEGGLQLRHVFLTHTHDDHMNGLAGLRQRFPKLLFHTNSTNAPPQHRNRSNDFIHLGSLRITNRETPGHTDDGVSYIVGNWADDAPHVAFIGDTLFAGSLATGYVSLDLLKAKVQAQLFSLPPTTLLCPGHGPITTVAEEKTHNPFFP